MSNKSGRKPKHWAERARVSAWYMEVKKRRWSDYKLNQEFALTEEEKAKRAKDREPVRTFDSIRRWGRQPLRGMHWRSEHDLIKAVDEHPLFRGTEKLYQAAIWDLFQEEKTSGDVIAGRIAQIFQQYSLMRVDPTEFEELANAYFEIGPKKLFHQWLVASLQEVEYWDRIVLMWSLFQQAIQSCSWDVCDVLEKDIDCWIDVFFSTRFSKKEYDHFYTEAMHALLNWRALDRSVDDTLGELKFEVSWPILPIRFAEKLTPSV